MQKKVRLGLCLLFVVGLMGWETIQATTFLELQSTYLGNGWFQYRMNVMNDPFFTVADIPSLAIDFTNEIAQSVDAANWSFDVPYKGSCSWSLTHSFPARPNTQTFLVHSSETSYRLASGTNADAALILMSLHLAGVNPGTAVFGQTIVGYAIMPCLIPCRPEDADGSPTNFVYDLKLVPDIQINRLIQGDGGVNGVNFTWGSESTLLLQGSRDLHQWTNITYLWSYPPETEWTTNQSLSDYGSFFRLNLIADGHVAQTNLPPLNNVKFAAKVATKIGGPIITRVTGCQFTQGKVAVMIASQLGLPLQVQVLNGRGEVLKSQEVVPVTSSTTVYFDAASLPSPAFFQAVLMP